MWRKNNNENKEVVIINNDYNIIEDNQIKQIQKKFTKNLDSSDESSNLEIQNVQINEYKDLIVNSYTKSRQQQSRIIDNNISIYRRNENNYGNNFDS